MQLIRRVWKALQPAKQKHLPSSLQLRLTVEFVVLSVLGLGSVAVWTSWKMEQILIVTHKQNVEYIAARFPHDVELYSDMLPLETGLQKTIDNVSAPGLLIWVKGLDGKQLAQSATLKAAFPHTRELMSFAEMPSKPLVYAMGDRFLVLCESPITVKGTLLGKVYLAADVTQERQQLSAALQNLALVYVLVLIDMSQLAGKIAAEDLGKAKLQLTHAPSEVKELAQTFNTMLSRLSDSWEQQRQFVSNVSHELRTPLTVVIGYLQSVLRRSTNLNDYQREALETAASEALRTVRLLQDLLDLARADNGYMHFHLEVIVLNDLVTEVAGMAEKFSYRLINIIATDNIQVIVDRDRLKQILINLIDNAVKYSAPEQPITLKLEQTERQALVQVCDRGEGIPLQDQSRIFERFYRVDASRSRSIDGRVSSSNSV